MTAEEGGEMVAALTYSGEAYNFRELRAELAAAGHHFSTQSDTEVVLRAYLAWGDDFVDRLNGMFAFAIWDTRRQELLLVRDRLGIKPLYIYERDGEIVFASELKPILQLPHIDRSINWEAASHLFAFLTTPASQSIVDGIRKLE